MSNLDQFKITAEILVRKWIYTPIVTPGTLYDIVRQPSMDDIRKTQQPYPRTSMAICLFIELKKNVSTWTDYIAYAYASASACI